MTSIIIITCCSIVLLAYLFDITAAKTKIPSVILLLLVGLGIQFILAYFNITVPNFNKLLPLIGTIGLILIVLEGSLELEIDATKKNVIYKSFWVALLPIIATTSALAFYFYYTDNTSSIKSVIINAIPFAVISSAIAIPTAKNLPNHISEFVVYESSLSDIFGVLLFNFFIANEVINAIAFGSFIVQILVMFVVAFVATWFLSYLLSVIKHHVKFVPILVLMMLVYSIAKYYHLPSLIFILIVGLFLGNIQRLPKIKGIKILQPEMLTKTVHKFTEVVTEFTFLVRITFFILFGFLIDVTSLLNWETLQIAVSILAIIYTIRGLQLWLFKLPIFPLIFLAPRGLITVLLFISILPENNLRIISKSLVIQVIVLSALIMMVGLIFYKKPTNILA